MSHTEIYTINGRKYRYEITNYRVGKKVKHKKKYLGPVNPINKRTNPNAGRKPKLKVRELTAEEKDFVQQNLKSSKSFVKDRTRIIQLSSDGNKVKQISQQLKFHRPKIEMIIKKFNEAGLKIFHRGKSTVKPRRITKEQRALILQWLNTHPEKLGLHFNNWSNNRLSDYAKKRGIQVSTRKNDRIFIAITLSFLKKTSDRLA